MSQTAEKISLKDYHDLFYYISKIFSLEVPACCLDDWFCSRCCAASAAAYEAVSLSKFCLGIDCSVWKPDDDDDDGSSNRSPSPALANLTSLFIFENKFLGFDISRNVYSFQSFDLYHHVFFFVYWEEWMNAISKTNKPRKKTGYDR